MKSGDYIDRVRAELNLPSDYAASKVLGVSRERLSRYRTGSEFNDEMAMRVAKLLKLNPLKVIADVRAATAKDQDVRRIWERLAAQASRLAPSVGAAVLTASLLGGTLPSPADASQVPDSHNKYYVKLRRRLERLLAILAKRAPDQLSSDELKLFRAPLIPTPGDRRGFQRPRPDIGRRSYDHAAA